MFDIAKAGGFYTEPPLPPWHSLPKPALDAVLHRTVPRSPLPHRSEPTWMHMDNKVMEQDQQLQFKRMDTRLLKNVDFSQEKGIFIPFEQAKESQYSDTSSLGLYGTKKFVHNKRLEFRSYPVGLFSAFWGGEKDWTKPAKTMRAKKREENKWINGFRWSAMDSYLRHCYAYAM